MFNDLHFKCTVSSFSTQAFNYGTIKPDTQKPEFMKTLVFA
ncbi:hypothetical protein D929_00164 [Enterococcus faecalis 02-MB-P-10]|nr:hypothetical protein D929_00164 [Enterococcus faecalis 02-MB-P-10]